MTTERITVDDLDPWLLSGEPVVRFAGRDFSQSVDEYIAWIAEISASTHLPIATLKISEPPGVVVQAYKGDAPTLLNPMLRAGRITTPWLFCLQTSCKNRVGTPGMMCPTHVQH